MKTASIREGWEGRTLDGRFPLLEWLGGSDDRGVFLTVLQGIQTATIKLIPASHTDAAAYLAQWERAKALSHPHLVQIFESERTEIEGCELVYVVAERAEETLSQIIRDRVLDADETRKILDAALDALSYIHAKGFVHGHVKPSNILLIDGDWKLSGDDVSVASDFPHRSLQPSGYDAPELATGAITAASDIWSLGMTLAEALTQRLLSLDASAKGGPIVPESVPQPFLDIVRGCTRLDPAQRCNIRQIKDRLAAHDTLPASAKPIPAPAEAIPVSPDPVPVVSAAIPIARHEALANDSTPVAPGLPPAPTAAPAPDAIHSSVPAEPVEPEPQELFSRPLFSNIEEREHKSRSWSPVVFSVLILLAVAAVFVTRDRWIKPAPHVATKSVPAPAPAPSTPAPTSPGANQTPQQAVPTPSPSQAQTARPSEQAAPQSQSPTASKPRTQSAPATSEATPAPPPSESKTPKGGTTEGAVAKRVLPKASPSASRNIRGSVKVAVRVSVNRSGTVSNAAYLSPGPGNYFARISLQAARSWKFRPPKSAGHPEPSAWTLHFSFWPTRIEASATDLR